jgi:hypothetical protein
MTLMAATLASPALAEPLPKTNGLYTAQVGAQCVTQQNAWATRFLWDATMINQIIETRDQVAWSKLLGTERIIFLRPDLTLFVTQRLETSIQVRPKGETFELWMNSGWVDCGTTSAETTEIAKPPKPTKITKTMKGAR